MPFLIPVKLLWGLFTIFTLSLQHRETSQKDTKHVAVSYLCGRRAADGDSLEVFWNKAVCLINVAHMLALSVFSHVLFYRRTCDLTQDPWISVGLCSCTCSRVILGRTGCWEPTAHYLNCTGLWPRTHICREDPAAHSHWLWPSINGCHLHKNTSALTSFSVSGQCRA